MVSDITAEDVQAFGTEVLKRLHIETLIHGNSTAEVSHLSLLYSACQQRADRQDAKQFSDMVERVISPRPLAEAEKSHPRSLLLPPGKLPLVWRLRGSS